MPDVTKLIEPKSDQLNAEDLVSGDLTAMIQRVDVRQTRDQPISVFLDSHDRPWKPCKSTARVMAKAWGKQTEQWVGQSVILFCDPAVTWAGAAVGGIRIKAITGIDKPLTINLAVSKGKRKPVTVQPLRGGAGPQQQGEQPQQTTQSAAPVATQAEIEHLCAALKRCETLDDLKTVWGSAPRHVKAHAEAVKDDVKNRLASTPPPEFDSPDVEAF